MEKAGFSAAAFVDCPEAETEEGYQRFLDFALTYADGFTLCCQKLGFGKIPLEPEEFPASPWGYLADSVYDCEQTSESPVTTGPQVLLLYFRFDDVTKKLLRERKNVYDFQGQDFLVLWDLAFLREGKIFFCSCTHERFCSIDGDALRCFRRRQ